MTTVKTAQRGNEGATIRRLYRSSVLSIIIAAVAAMFGMLIDGIVIGKFLGTESMAAYGLITPLFSIMTAVSGVLAVGSQVFCAKYLGAGRIDRARQVFSVCMTATAVIAAVIMAVLLFACEPLCMALGARNSAADLLPLTKGYLYGISPGILPVLLLFVFNSLMRLDGDPNRVIAAVAAMTVFDIAGDLLNALVIHGGMIGMGISTAVSYWIALFIMLLHFRRKDIIFRFSFRKMSGKDFMGILMIGAPTAIASTATMVRNLILNLIMVSIAGNTAVAALSVRNTLNTLFGSILIGIGMTTTMIAGMIYGEEDRSGAGHLMKVSLRYACGIGTAMAVVVFLCSPILVSLFASGKADSVQMSELAVRAMRIYAFGLPFYGINMVFIYYLQGIERLKLANLISLADNLLYVVLIALVFAPAIRADAVWIAYPVGEVLVILTVLFAAVRERKHFPRKTEDILFLKEDFGASPDETFERSVESLDETMQTSRDLAAFMKERRATAKETVLVPLFVEEMTGNVVEHGFAKDSKKHSVDVRVLKKNDHWIIRIRDNCVSFDPLSRASDFDPEDPAANIGIRMVRGMAGDVRYVNAMQLNNLIIQL